MFSSNFNFFLSSWVSYCSKFPSSGVGFPVPICRTEATWTDCNVELMSTLYLPRNSPVYWPIRVRITISYRILLLLLLLPIIMIVIIIMIIIIKK